MINYWLMKSEPSVYSIDDLQRQGVTGWEGVRNYQARNFMKAMHKGDLILFYHSNAKPPGVAGIGRITKESYPDTTALDPKSQYFDPKASQENPIWMSVDVSFVEKLKHFVTLDEMRKISELKDMKVLQPGSRLSVQPISSAHYKVISKLGR